MAIKSDSFLNRKVITELTRSSVERRRNSSSLSLIILVRKPLAIRKTSPIQSGIETVNGDIHAM